MQGLPTALTFPPRRRKFPDDAIRTLTKIRSLLPEYTSLSHFLFKFTNQTEVCINCSDLRKKTRRCVSVYLGVVVPTGMIL